MTNHQRTEIERVLRSLSDLEDCARGVAIAAKMAAENLETAQQILFNMLAPADESSGRDDY
jgi:hypothetical protein